MRIESTLQGFDTETLTRMGGRDVNMDVCAHIAERGFGCWIVADGAGSHAGSEVAARVAADAAIAAFRRAPAATPDAAESLVHAAHRAVLERKAADPRMAKIATTLVVLVSDGRTAAWAHVGDSRLYHLRDGIVISQTRDHSAAQARADHGDIRPDQIRGDAMRSLLTQAVGQDNIVPTVSSSTGLCFGDAFLLCVDGFWEKAYETEVEIDFAKTRSAREWLDALERRVAARVASGSDNYTAVCVRIGDASLPLPGSERRSQQPAKVSVTQPRNRMYQLVAAVVALAVGGLAGWGIALFRGERGSTPTPPVQGELLPPPECAAEWQRIALSANDLEYRQFMRDFPKCPEVKSAGVKLNGVLAWRRVNYKDPAEIKRFIDENPEAPDIDRARGMLADLSTVPPGDPCQKTKDRWASTSKRDLVKIAIFLAAAEKCSPRRAEVAEAVREARRVLASARSTAEQGRTKVEAAGKVQLASAASRAYESAESLSSIGEGQIGAGDASAGVMRFNDAIVQYQAAARDFQLALNTTVPARPTARPPEVTPPPTAGTVRSEPPPATGATTGNGNPAPNATTPPHAAASTNTNATPAQTAPQPGNQAPASAADRQELDSRRVVTGTTANGRSTTGATPATPTSGRGGTRTNAACDDEKAAWQRISDKKDRNERDFLNFLKDFPGCSRTKDARGKLLELVGKDDRRLRALLTAVDDELKGDAHKADAGALRNDAQRRLADELETTLRAVPKAQQRPYCQGPFNAGREHKKQKRYAEAIASFDASIKCYGAGIEVAPN